MYLKSVSAFIKKNSLFFFLVIALLAGTGGKSYAQLCTGSLGDPVFTIDFGQGIPTHGSALAPGTTSYTNSNADFPSDGSYTIENTTAGAGNIWWPATDHTNNSGGYMMVVNASVLKTDYFYRTTVPGLCPGTRFEFAAWIMNLLRTNDISPPNITFNIRTTAGILLASYDTQAIPVTPGGPVWKQYGTYFTTPVAGGDIIVEMVNNSNGGAPANDLALDDITFRPCGPIVTSAFVAGTNQSLTQVACEGQALNYTLISTVQSGVYNNAAYQWQINTGAGWSNIAGANANTYDINIVSSIAGTYKYRMLTSESTNAGSPSCQVSSNELTLTVSAKPVAKFNAVPNINNCRLSVVDFQDISTSPTAISGWSWDFDDPASGSLNTSIEKNPSHSFVTAGDHNVTLTVYNSGSCSKSMTTRVHTDIKLAADFDASSSACPNSVVTFTDKSISSTSIQYWIWNFGDGSQPDQRTNNAPFTHTYAKTGKYNVTLEVRTPANCVSDLRTIEINVVAVNFNVCPGDITQFTDLTAIVNSGLIYNWDFGDAAATVANPNTSANQNPTHKYNPGSYTATLTVASLNGCPPASKSISFVVGAGSAAKFDIQNRNNLCGADSVTFVDLSVISDKITKLVWYFDIDNNPAGTVVAVRSDKKYRYFYAANNTNLPITYHAMLVAYTATGCPYAATLQDVVINPVPVVTLKVNGSALVSPVNLCPSDNPVTIMVAANVPGSGAFSGNGISPQGMFDPKLSGSGTFAITYLYTAANSGCTASASFEVIVNPFPVIKLVAAAEALEGGQTKLNATATGSNLSYLWSPAAGVSDPTILDPVFSPTQQTTYTLTVTPAKGCAASAQVVVSVLKTPVVPNAFTPNNDGINDAWDIKYLDTYPDATVEVFSRYGARVFSSNGYTVPWDGKFKGTNLPFGVYYYVINPKRGRTVMTGSLTIIK